MTVKEAAAKMKISESLVYQLVTEGRLRCFRIGSQGRRGKVVISAEHIDAFLKTCELKDVN
jgi:excisionase family DNA binding protein